MAALHHWWLFPSGIKLNGRRIWEFEVSGWEPKCQIERVQASVIEGDQTDSTKPKVLMDAHTIMNCNRWNAVLNKEEYITIHHRHAVCAFNFTGVYFCFFKVLNVLIGAFLACCIHLLVVFFLPFLCGTSEWMKISKLDWMKCKGLFIGGVLALQTARWCTIDTLKAGIVHPKI